MSSGPSPAGEGERVTPGQADAERVKRARERPRRSTSGRRAHPAAEDPGQAADPQLLEQQARDMGEEVRTYWNKIAEARGYEQIPDRAVLKVGTPAAAVAQKYGLASAIMRWPELALLLALVPYLWSAIRIELRRRQEGKRTTKPVDRSGARAPRAQEIRTIPEAAATGAPRYEGTSLTDVEPHA